MPTTTSTRTSCEDATGLYAVGKAARNADTVQLGETSVFAEATTYWLPWLRTLIGAYDQEMRQDKAEAPGKRSGFELFALYWPLPWIELNTDIAVTKASFAIFKPGPLWTEAAIFQRRPPSSAPLP